jgi:hypothetical protein
LFYFRFRESEISMDKKTPLIPWYNVNITIRVFM